MVCWAEPNPNVKPRTEEECDCLAAIREMESDRDLMEKVGNVEKAIKKQVKGVTACAEGALYSVPTLQIDLREKANLEPFSSSAFHQSRDLAADQSKILTLESYPWTEEQIRMLVSHCGRAPWGGTERGMILAGNQSHTDRRCWQLEPERMLFKNLREWETKALRTLKRKVIQAMASPKTLKEKDVSLNFHKMLVYEENGKYLPHRETPRSPHHFGTLFIILPVKHTGGNTFVRHQGEEWCVDSSKRKSVVRCTWAAFFNEAEYEVKEVTSGARVCLMYYIYGKSKSGEVPRAVPITVEENAVVKSLRSLANHGYGVPKRIGLILEHKYNPRVFSSEGLKGKDRLLYNLLVSSTFVIKLTFVRVLFCAIGPHDTCDCGIQDCQKHLIDQEVWEIDLSSEKEWQFGKKDHPCRKLPGEMPWLHRDLMDEAKRMSRVDKNVRGTGNNEGCQLGETYRTAALLITIDQSYVDAYDGAFTHFFPAADPEVPGVVSREDFDWGRAKWSLGPTEQDLVMFEDDDEDEEMESDSD